MTLIQNYKFAKYGPKAEMCFNFYEIWQLLIMNIIVASI